MYGGFCRAAKKTYYRGGLKAGFYCSVPCVNKNSPHARESKTVLGSGFCGVDSRFHVLDSRFFVSGTWIPDSNFSGFPDSLSSIPDSEAQESVFHRHQIKLPDSRFQIPDSGFLYVGTKGPADIVLMTAYQVNMAKGLI